MRNTARIALRVALAAAALAMAAARPAGAKQLKPETLEAYNRFVAARDAQFDRQSEQGPFLWVDSQPAEVQYEDYKQLRAGDVIIEQLGREVDGKKYEVPGGMVHHWVGIVFIPGAKLEAVVNLVEDYDHHSKYFAPEVVRSKLISRDDGHFLLYLRFHKKHILSVTIDNWQEAWYRAISPSREVSRSLTTRAQEVENPGQPDEKLLPEGNDRGFLWRMNTYWKFEEKDGGTYVQCESVTLTRQVPLLLKPIIEPFITSVPRESLVGVLTHTRLAVRGAAPGGAAPVPGAP